MGEAGYIDEFRNIFSLWELEGIASPCCLLINQLHHIMFLPFHDPVSNYMVKDVMESIYKVVF